MTTEYIFEVQREENPELAFELEEWSFTFQQTHRFRDVRSNRLGVQWNARVGRFDARVQLAPDMPVADRSELRAVLGASLFEDRRDSVGNPNRGRFWNLTFQHAPKALGSELEFTRLFGQLFAFYPMGRGVVWASSYRMGVAWGSEDFLFIDDRFRGGGANSVRGFEQDSLGPVLELPGEGTVVSLGGQGVAVFNQELRFPVYRLIHGGVFYDAGNVFASASQFRLRDLRHSVGAGIRLVLSFGALRFDWARVLNEKPGDRLTRFHFSFGYAF